jgi:Family of unknown function (DUF6311)
MLGAVCLGVVAFFVTMPAYVLDPTNLEWIFHFPSKIYTHMDITLHYLGWCFLRHAPTSFPLGSIPNYMSPLNTYLAYTDSIPLAAYSLRMISAWLPEDFQYLGPWMLLCFVLQSVFALKILRRWIRDPFCLMIAVTMVAFSPVLIFRWNHVALMSHWLILWCIDMNCDYFVSKRQDPEAKLPTVRSAFVLSMATLIQPYIALMVAGLCWAMPLARFFGERKNKAESPAKPFFRLVVATILLMLPMVGILYIFGLFSGSAKIDGFHWFSTDFLSLFNNFSTSSFVPAFRKKAGLYEGYAWPGVGGWIFLISMLLPGARRKLLEFMREPSFKGIMVACGLMWFYAFGERIYIGTFWIVDLEAFWSPLKVLTTSVRVAGRFIWPGYYLLIMTAMVATANFYDRKKARYIFAGALLFQAIDLGPWMMDRAHRFPIFGRQKLVSPFWENEASHFEHIKFIPPYQEGGYCEVESAIHLYEWVELAKFAALHNQTINSGVLARYDRFISQLYCRAHTYEFLTGPLAADTLYVVRRGFQPESSTVGPDRACRDIDGYMVCTAIKRDPASGE